ncbi:MAG: hypothetical protein FJ291_24330 [Planctomycetes bacterium]|nr:hypothetical protein [Planctomycetota bacterium]
MASREAASAPGSGPFTGITRGALKAAASPLQLPMQVFKGVRQKNIFYGSTIGLIKGVTKGVSDLVGGSVQVVSNAIPPNPLELVTRKLAYIKAAKGL